MPSFMILGFRFFFWSNEFSKNGKLEPIHIHVTKEEPSKDAPKWWVGYKGIEKDDKTFDNIERFGLKKSDIPKIELIIIQNKERIIQMWEEHFEGYDCEIYNSLI